jgi:hypothetical protein
MLLRTTWRPTVVGKIEGGSIMYLMHKPSGDLVEMLNLESLFDPFRREVNGRFHAGEEMQEPAAFAKSEMVFPSGEYLPRCWLDPAYKTRLHAVSAETGVSRGHDPRL